MHERGVFISRFALATAFCYLPFPFLYLLTYSVINLFFNTVSIKKKKNKKQQQTLNEAGLKNGLQPNIL